MVEDFECEGGVVGGGEKEEEEPERKRKSARVSTDVGDRATAHNAPLAGRRSVIPGHDNLVLLDIDALPIELDTKALEKLGTLALVDDCKQ